MFNAFYYPFIKSSNHQFIHPTNYPVISSFTHPSSLSIHQLFFMSSHVIIHQSHCSVLPLSIHIPIQSSINPSNLSHHPIFHPAFLFYLQPFKHPPINPPTHAFCLIIYSSISSSIQLSSQHTPICPSTIQPSIHPSICPSVMSSLHQTTWSIVLSNTNPSLSPHHLPIIHLSTYPITSSVHASICPLGKMGVKLT